MQSSESLSETTVEKNHPRRKVQNPSSLLLPSLRIVHVQERTIIAASFLPLNIHQHVCASYHVSPRHSIYDFETFPFRIYFPDACLLSILHRDDRCYALHLGRASPISGHQLPIGLVIRFCLSYLSYFRISSIFCITVCIQGSRPDLLSSCQSFVANINCNLQIVTNVAWA
jgi:hypothetical protein